MTDNNNQTRRMRKLILIFLIPFFIFSCARKEEKEALEIHFIDIGYGDAVLVKKGGGEALLIDNGYPEKRRKLFDYLKEHEVRELDYLINTHPHPDHLGNAVAVLNNLRVKILMDNGQKIDQLDKWLTGKMVEDYQEHFRGHPSYRVLKAGDKIQWGEVLLEVLWPPDTTTYNDWNTNSLLIMLSYGELRALLAADFNERGERVLLRQKGLNLKADLLKVGHHGGGDATGPEFLRAVSPSWAVISVGENPWDYPSPNVLRRLEEARIEVFRTDREGTIVFRYLPPEDIEILTSGKNYRRKGLRDQTTGERID